MNRQEENKSPYFTVPKSPLGAVLGEMIAGDKQATCNWVKGFFDDLYFQIREIKEGEKECYAKIKEIFASFSADYVSNDPDTRHFFSTVQNKLLWAVTGKTAAEIIICRAHGEKPNMGIRTWKNGPQGKIRKSDLYSAGNYLTAGEIHDLEHLSNLFLDYALEHLKELQPLILADWSDMLDRFLLQCNRDLMPEEEGRTIYMIEEIIEKEYEEYCRNDRPERA